MKIWNVVIATIMIVLIAVPLPAQTTPIHSVKLDWTLVDGSGVKVQRATTPTGPFMTRVTLPAVLEYIDTNVFAGITYYYNVIATAVDAATGAILESAPSNLVAAAVPADPPQTGCYTTGSTWSITGFPVPTTGVFTFQIESTPQPGALLDAVFGLSSMPFVGYADAATLIRFSQAGVIEAYDGARMMYAAETMIQYIIGQTYHIWMVIDPVAKSYDVLVQLPNQTTPVKIATGFKFRSPADILVNTQYVSISEAGMLKNCNLGIGQNGLPAPPVVTGITITPTSQSLPSVVQGGSLQFTPVVTCSAPGCNQNVFWTTTGSTINQTGLLTASGAAGSITVKAASLADPTKTATTIVKITPGPIGPDLTPPTVSFSCTKNAQNIYCDVSATDQNGVSYVAFSVNGQLVDVHAVTPPRPSMFRALWPVSAFQTGSTVSFTVTVKDAAGNTTTKSVTRTF